MATNLMANSSIYGGTGTNSISAVAGTDRLASDKQTFLKLLVVQLTHQDPLNPTEDKEFITQLAQFTSLEQLQEINAGMETLNTTMNQSQLMTATGFIGKDVVASGQQVTKLNVAGQIVTTQAWYTIDEDVAKGQVNIYDGSGNLVYYEDLTARNAGSYNFPWNGKNLVGQEVPSGVYTIIVSAQNSDDKTVMVKQQMTARVMGVMNEDGVYKLILDGGRVVPLMDVTEITDATETSNSSTANTYSGLAANAAAAASIARDDADNYAQKTIDSTTASDAERHAKNAIKAAETARAAATVAETNATKARTEAENAKTADALEEYNKAKANADKAEEYATAAEDAAKTAKEWAEDKFNIDFG